MTRGRWVVLALGVVLVAGVAVGGYLLWNRQQDSELCRAIQAGRDALLREPFEGGRSHVVLAVGDSYTQAASIGGPAQAWPARLAEVADATVTVDGMSSTGYTTAGFCPGDPFTYAERLAERDVAEGTTVVLQGSVNDGLSGEPDDVEARADAALEEVEGAGRVVVVGPPTIPALDAAALGTIDRGLAAAAEAHDAVYLSLLDEAIPISADDVHPTAEGQERIARLVAGALG